MKKILITVLVSLCLGSTLYAAPPHSGWKTDDIVMLRDKMKQLQTDYSKLEERLAERPLAYDEISALLDRMEGAAKMIQKLNDTPPLDGSFKKLLRDIRGLSLEAKAHRSSVIDNGMNQLFENCFSCHLTHSLHSGKRQQS